ncbi:MULTISPECIES: response regulator [unclassified Leeuwenhoekiella]|uniref:response regulator n=1 Tax=unclassified Leeuwenhoekiella TaxID=2615029 RepID=UPI000C37BEC2|nr:MULTISPECIES: response regulator [unclassified Leeuwenhoekiella]MAW94428.1 response regulator [Leeuwenhoekiella sp.]MBA81105.1 response regulator [Leeuwenhoekiella sp.]|tara:strand:+ start:2647 stop:3060 length:414 start_codon:yes stop_codon:yes gene_type:complete
MKKSDVLIVDDDDVYLYVASHILKGLSQNLSVECCTDGEQAINLFKDRLESNIRTPDLVLLDINMPYLDGWGFLEEYRKLKPELYKESQIYLVTSSNQDDDLERARQYEELKDYIVKPVSRDKLLQILTEVYNGYLN